MVTEHRFTNKAFAMLYTGQDVGRELDASSEEFRAWVVIKAFVDDGSAWRRPYRGVESPSFDVWRFEVRRSSLDAGYDVVGELMDERHIIVHPEATTEETIRSVERALLSWSIDPATLGPLDDDFPLP